MAFQYETKTFQLPELEGLSAKQIEAHLGLYAGYVKHVNVLHATVEELMRDSEKNAYALSEVKRRLGFEFNGMRLHEYYFEQFEKAEGESAALKEELAKQFGSFEAWKAEFSAVGKMRGIGWALLILDERTGALMNVWVSDHELGQLGGTKIILAMDIWEHAYMVDYLPSERAKYIDAFFANLAWEVVEKRYR